MSKQKTEKPSETTTAAAEPDESGLLFAKFIEFGDEVTTVTFHDKKFTIPAFRADWPTKGMQALQRQHHVEAVELILGPEQWDRFNDLFPKLAQFWEFFPIFAEATGFVRLGDVAKAAEDAGATGSSTEG